MESWDWSPLSHVQVQFQNTTTLDGNSHWNVDLCDRVYSNLHDYGSFTGGSGSIKFHQPSDTFYMMFENGDKGDGCETDPRQSDVYIHCQGCPTYLEESNPACTLQSAPCICAAYDTGCIGEVHMAANCPVGESTFMKSASSFISNSESFSLWDTVCEDKRAWCLFLPCCTDPPSFLQGFQTTVKGLMSTMPRPASRRTSQRSSSRTAR